MLAAWTTAGVAFFCKQASAPRPGQDSELDGEVIHQFPVPRRVVAAEF